MKNKKKILFSSIMVIALCMSLIAGSTFALFTSESKVNIAVTSGKVKVAASLAITNIYSAEASDDVEEGDGNYAGEATAYDVTSAYKWVDRTSEGKFTTLGTATIDSETGALKLDKIVPGDKAVATINVTNESNVSAKYRIRVNADEAGYSLASALRMNVDEDVVNRESVASYISAWKDLPIGTNPTHTISIDMPVEKNNDYQNLSAAYSVTVEAVQGNGAVAGNMTINYIQLATKEVTEDKVTLNQGGNVADNQGAVTAEVAKGAWAKEDVAPTMYIAETAETGTVTISSNQTVIASYNISVVGLKENNETAIPVSINIGTGHDVSTVHIYHNNVEVTGVTYNATTGIATFSTTTFSPFVVVVGMTSVSEETGVGFYQVGNEYRITNAKGLTEFANQVNTGTNFSGKTVKLMNDINLNNAKWTPIGACNTPAYFQGTFDGQGYTVYGLNVDNSQDEYQFSTSGLFGWIDAGKATIKNVNINGATVKGSHWTGALVGYMTGSVINCSVSNSTVTCYNVNDDANGDKVGGLIGFVNSGSIEVSGNTVSNVIISGYRDVAGLVGFVTADCIVKNNEVKDSQISYNVVKGSGSAEIVGDRSTVQADETNKATNCMVSIIAEN